MTFNYAESAADAMELLTEFGRSATIKSIASGTYSPSTSSVANSETPQTGTGVVLDYPQRDVGTSSGPGTLIEATDKKLLLGVDGITIAPKPEDTVLIGDGSGPNDGTYTVKSVKALAPAGVAVLYTLQLRK